MLQSQQEDQNKFYLSSEENLMELAEKERSAVLICGSQLGECYMCAELNRMLLNDARIQFNGKPFFKTLAKKHFGIAVKKNMLHTNQFSKDTDISFAREFADNVTFSLYDDVGKLRYAIKLELQHYKIPYADDIALMEVISVIADIAVQHYDSVMQKMKKFFSLANYNSWYCHIKQDDFQYSWNEFLKIVTDKYVPEDVKVDLNNNVNISNGVKVLINKIMSYEFCKNNESKALEEVGDKTDKTAIMNAFDMFDIKIQ